MTMEPSRPAAIRRPLALASALALAACALLAPSALGGERGSSAHAANRANIPHYLSSPSATTTAQYYQALRRLCTTCTVIGLDVLDQAKIGPTLEYIAEFKREVGRLHTVMPGIWGLHDYSDVNRMESWRTREVGRALGGQLWLTETGGIVQFGGAFPNRRGSGLSRAAPLLSYTL